MSVKWESITNKLMHRKLHKLKRGKDRKNFVNRQSSTNRMLKRKLLKKKRNAKKIQQSSEVNPRQKAKND